jgi:choline dehydrogenase-like flavoprotein
MESYQGRADDEYRGRNGPLTVMESIETGPLYDALIKAAGRVGIGYTSDYNGAQQDGIGMTQMTIRGGGRRMSPARCYLDPVRCRPNVTIQANALTECLLLEGKRCISVLYTVDGEQHEARANREVIVSAGSINSPQLLEMSGIGQPELLKSIGIEVRHVLKAVGENPRDHYSSRMKWSVPPSLGMTYTDKMRGLGKVKQALMYALTHKGLLGMPAAPIRAYIRTRSGLDAPDAAISWVPFFMTHDVQLAKNTGLTAITHTRVRMVANPKYWRQGEPVLSEVVLTVFSDNEAAAAAAALETGAVDVIYGASPRSAVRLRGSSFQLIQGPGPLVQVLRINSTRGPFRNPKLTPSMPSTSTRGATCDRVNKTFGADV